MLKCIREKRVGHTHKVHCIFYIVYMLLGKKTSRLYGTIMKNKNISQKKRQTMKKNEKNA